MKIRIRDHSIRFRLNQTEVRQLMENRTIESFTIFPDGSKFSYALSSGSNYDATFSENRIHIEIPEDQMKGWALSENPGLEKMLAIPDNNSLRILIEKDLKCLKERPLEDDSDAFPNPMVVNC